MTQIAKKCSTILIATGARTRVYHSIEEIPEQLREQLLDSTRGANSATLLIADRNGREEILKAVQRSSPDRYSRLVAALISKRTPLGPRRSKLVVLLPAIGRALLVGCLGYVLWVLATLR